MRGSPLEYAVGIAVVEVGGRCVRLNCTDRMVN